MASIAHRARRAFTLIELLVVMAVIVALASIALLVVNNADGDRTTDGSALLRQYLMIAKARAARDQAPRGVRLIVSMDPNNPAKTNPFWVTELQYIEKLPVYIPAPILNVPPIASTDPLAPKVSFFYNTNPPSVFLQNLTAGDVPLIVPNGLLTLYNLGFSGRIVPGNGLPSGVGAPVANGGSPGNPNNPSGLPGTFDVQVNLDTFPDASIGAGTSMPPMPTYVSYQFGVTTPAQPLIGEPLLQLPTNICVDLSFSTIPSPTASPMPPPPYFQNPTTPPGNGGDYDIVFLPSGQVDPNCSVGSSSQVFLWLRDYTKLQNAPNGNHPLVVLNPMNSPPPIPIYDSTPFTLGGEQQIVALKTKTGSMGAFPVSWPDGAGHCDPYAFARMGATSP